VAGDPLYGAKKTEWERFFLHAHRLGFKSPATGEWVAVDSPLAPELEQWLRSLSVE
jgi:23S rRNA pseudouridine1911/1915/1917 synthase